MDLRRFLPVCAALVAVAVPACGSADGNRPVASASSAVSSGPGRTPDGRCLPAPLQITPASASPGMTITVSSTGGCTDGSLRGAEYRLSLGFEGRQTAMVGAWSVFPTPDGEFSAGIQVPSNAEFGTAHLSVAGSPYDVCEDTNSCVGYSTPFEIASFPATDHTGMDVFGPGSWSGARTTADRNQLIIALVGGPEYQADNHCSVAYQAEVVESDTEVRVQFTGTRPSSPDEGSVFCTAEGYYRPVVVLLNAPLGARRLVDVQFSRTMPVFDGSRLATPRSLPDGWKWLREGPAVDPESIRYWSQTWGAPAPPPSNGRCVPSPSAIMLTQGPADVLEKYPSNGEQPESTEDVNGHAATYLDNGALGMSRVQWEQDGQGFVLASLPGCEGDTPTSKDALLEFARTLRIPT